MILHIVPDEKFIDRVYRVYKNVNPNNNVFITTGEQKELKYIKKTPIIFIKRAYFLSRKFADSLQQYDFVVLHFLSQDKMKLVLNAPSGVNFLWIGWGGDYYEYLNINLMLEKTRKLYIRHNKINYYEKVKQYVKHLAKIILRYNIDIERVFNKISYFAPVIDEDYLLVKNTFPRFKPKYIDLNNGTLEDDLIGDMELKVQGRNILVGNSATYENNHIEAFDLLKKCKMIDRKVVLPLVYGVEKYRDAVIRMGNKAFGNSLLPIVDFLPMMEYNQIIRSCSVIIMNHTRQQGVGNIVTGMYYGAKIFLRKENAVYRYFKKQGAIILTIQDITDAEINSLLTDNEISTNREILIKQWGRKAIYAKTIDMINRVGPHRKPNI